MAEINMRELRNHGGQVVERVLAGERLTITRAGKPVAELAPLASPPLSAEVLLQRRRTLPMVDPAALRSDIDAITDQTL